MKPHTADWAAFALVLVLLWLLPPALGGFYLYLGCMVAIYAIAALGLQVMAGLAGQLSLGHAAFIGIGAYAAVLLEQHFGLPFLLAAPLAGAITGLVGLLMAQLIRLSGTYFDIATLGFGIIVAQMLGNWTALTGGHNGLRGVPNISLFGWEARSRTDLFLLEAATLTLVYLLLLRLSHGRIGRAFRALAEDMRAARSIGVPVTSYRMAVISIGCSVAGIGGSFLPHLMHYLSPDSFTWHESLIPLIMITVGGLGSLPGAVIGAAVLIVLPEYLRGLAELKMLVFGALLVLSMAFLPRGIAGLIGGLSVRLRLMRA